MHAISCRLQGRHMRCGHQSSNRQRLLSVGVALHSMPVHVDQGASNTSRLLFPLRSTGVRVYIRGGGPNSFFAMVSARLRLLVGCLAVPPHGYFVISRGGWIHVRLGRVRVKLCGAREHSRRPDADPRFLLPDYRDVLGHGHSVARFFAPNDGDLFGTELQFVSVVPT
jgi:hypothetical protein